MTRRASGRRPSSRALGLAGLLSLAGCGGGGAAQQPSSPPSSPAPTTVATAEPTAPGPSPAPSADTTTPRARDLVRPPEASTVADLLALERPVIIAHAGGDLSAPHSTMFAYTEAALAGVDVLELDVMLTGDGVLVVQHDDTVDRTTESTGRVRDLTYDELAALDNAYWFAGVWSDQSRPPEDYVYRGIRTGQRPPPPGYTPEDFRVETFRSIAEAFPDHVLDVEIKVPRNDAGEDDLAFAIEGARVLAAEIAELGRTDSVVVVSFSDEVLAAFRELAPDVATSPGLDTLVAWYAGADVQFAPQDVVFQVPPEYEGVEVLVAETIERARSDGFGVWVWMNDADTQENADFYAELAARGVDGLIVSRPAEAVARLRPG
jgi:glycerophosphoryl diester phosphodiesterase